ncbi:MAG: discoidin domain-containing protein [Lentisphaeria bacterium]|nr:discoidin domain-containing protein [Lentisphaeria bacterium]
MKLCYLLLLLLLPLSFRLSAAADGAEPNLNRLPGVTVTADSHHLAFTPERAVDGDAETMAGRWVSGNSAGGHFLAVEYGKRITVNQIRLQFWQTVYKVPNTATEFEVRGRTAEGWKPLRRVSGNLSTDLELAFPATELDAIRIDFHKTVPDNMVRLYEFSAFHRRELLELSLSGMAGEGIMGTGRKPELELTLCSTKLLRAAVRGTLYGADGREAAAFERETELSGKQRLALPPPPEFGRFRWEFTAAAASGRSFRRSFDFLYLPPANAFFRTASPFGAHYHNPQGVLCGYLGIHWWRNHDNYGRWNQCMTGAGEPDWANYLQRQESVKREHRRECSVLLGAPKRYSTILPGEPVYSDAAPAYSFYPPSDPDAWLKLYCLPLAEHVKQSSPFRAYEIWNEAWSYYRLRGTHGTPGEMMQLFRVTYEALKKADPAALVYPTDVKPEMVESRYAYRNFGRDMLKLGYLRWADLISYHSYGKMEFSRLEKIRRNAWLHGRDLELWSTETATPDKPFGFLMESLLAHRLCGNGKTFLYNGALWAPLYRGGTPSMELAGVAALVRELGDARPIGIHEADGVRCSLFANGPEAVAACFTDSEAPVAVNLPSGAETQWRDLFGNALPPGKRTVAAGSPLFIAEPDAAFVREVAANRLRFHADKAGKDPSAALLRHVADRLPSAGPEELSALVAELDKARAKWRGDALYHTNFGLDLLNTLRLMQMRAGRLPLPAAPPPEKLAASIRALYRRAEQRTGGAGALLNTERLISRAQKEYQYAMQYASDGDDAARALHLERASAELAQAKRRIETEQPAPIYRPHGCFRAARRLIRSELYCFAAGKAQTAVVTVANPFGRTLSGELAVQLPPGWSSDRTALPYEVEPYSRQLIEISLTAPAPSGAGGKHPVRFTDKAGNIPPFAAECEVVDQLPDHPILDGQLSTGLFTGN